MYERFQKLKNSIFPSPDKPKREYGSSVSKILEEKLRIGIMHAEDLRDELISDPQNEPQQQGKTNYLVGEAVDRDFQIGYIHRLPSEDHYKIVDDLVRHIRQIMGENPFAEDVKIVKDIFMDKGSLQIESLKEKYKPHRAELEVELHEGFSPDATILMYYVKINDRWLMEFKTWSYSKKFKNINEASIQLTPIITEEDLVILNKNPKRDSE